MYSHDSFGLGHLRRCRAIARAMVTRSPDLDVLILSGQPLIERYDSHSRIHVKLLPEIRKLKNGEYLPIDGDDINAAIEHRARLIRESVEAYSPDVVLIDKEPMGIRGEMAPALELLKERGVPVILGLRDVMDAPDRLAAEWSRKQAFRAIEEYYDEIWVYGVPEMFDPLAGLDFSDDVRRRVFYTSYIRRAAAEASRSFVPSNPFLLVTTGGGGDGEDLVDLVLSAREHHDACGSGEILPLLIVSGPFMNAEAREAFDRRAARLRDVQIMSFVSHMESLIVAASGVVAMCGYNTFCEILSFDKPSLLVPRTAPRLEQYIRASRAQELGLAAMLAPSGDARDVERMAKLLVALPDQPLPSSVPIPGLLDGHMVIPERTTRWLESASAYSLTTWLERSRSS
jgi:predicted glycosyltransferase